MPVINSGATIEAKAGSNKQFLSLTFPVCSECDAARQRVDKVEGKKAGRGCLIGLPIGVVGYFVYHFLAARDTISWFGMVLGWVLAYLAIFLLFGKKLTKDTIDPHDQEVSEKVKSAVKMNLTQAILWTDGTVTIHFENAMYAHEFQSANSAKITKMWD
jgi:hypothetical protein